MYSGITGTDKPDYYPNISMGGSVQSSGEIKRHGKYMDSNQGDLATSCYNLFLEPIWHKCKRNWLYYWHARGKSSRNELVKHTTTVFIHFLIINRTIWWFWNQIIHLIPNSSVIRSAVLIIWLRKYYVWTCYIVIYDKTKLEKSLYSWTQDSTSMNNIK